MCPAAGYIEALPVILDEMDGGFGCHPKAELGLLWEPLNLMTDMEVGETAIDYGQVKDLFHEYSDS